MEKFIAHFFLILLLTTQVAEGGSLRQFEFSKFFGLSDTYTPKCSPPSTKQLKTLEQIANKVSQSEGLNWETLKSSYAKRPEINKFLRTLDYGAGKYIRANGQYSKGNKPKKRFTKKCYKYVKTALLKSGLSTKYLPGAKAVQAKGTLEKEGFVNVLNDPKIKDSLNSYNDFPTGTILVFSGGKAGHIEVKTDSGFVSDFVNKRPRTGSMNASCHNCKYKFSGRGRKLVGAYILGEALNDSKFGYAKNN